MKKLALVGAVGFTLLAGSAMAQDQADLQKGQTLFNTYCVACHVTTGTATIAPPVFAVVQRVKKDYSGQEEFVDRVVDWVANPSVEEALMKGAVKKFGVMPTLGYAEADVRLIAEYLYAGDLTVPAEFAEKHGDGQGHDDH